MQEKCQCDELQWWKDECKRLYEEAYRPKITKPPENSLRLGVAEIEALESDEGEATCSLEIVETLSKKPILVYDLEMRNAKFVIVIDIEKARKMAAFIYEAFINE